MEIIWKITESIAIETSYESLSSQLPDRTNDNAELIHIGKVKYIDYSTDSIQDITVFDPFMHKRKSFEHEKEIRAIIHVNKKIGYSLKNDIFGISVAIDLEKLIKCIHIAPNAPSWFSNLVEDTVKKFGYAFPIKQSNLASEPLY